MAQAATLVVYDKDGTSFTQFDVSEDITVKVQEWFA